MTDSFSPTNWARLVKRFILYVGLELYTTNDLANLENYDTGVKTKIYNDRYEIKYLVRDLIPKVYTITSEYRFLDTADNVSQKGIYKD